MPQNRSSRVAIAATTTLSVFALTSGALIAVAPAASAAPASGAYSATAAADLVHLDVANFTGVVDVANVTVAPVTSAVSTATTPRVTSHATNVNAALLGVINENLVVDALQTAPPDNASGVHEELLHVPAAPLLTADITTADAHSRWKADDSCFTTGPLSTSISKVADLAVLPAAAPGGASVLALDNDNDPSGAVVSATGVSLKKPAGAVNHGVETTSLTEVTSINVANGLVIDVVEAPKVVAFATGSAATSKVDLVQPVLRINGTTYISGQDLAPIAIPGGPVLELSVGHLAKTIAADGSTASGSGYLLSLKVLDITGTLTLAELTVGDVSASATVPVGGINCTQLTPDPLRDARKDASAETVNASMSFDYTITVPNRGNADLTNVKVVDTVTGSPALTLVKAVPAPISHSGNVYTFSLGTIAPNQVKTITMKFSVPAGTPIGTKYSNSAVITAIYGGTSITKTVASPHPTVDGKGTGPCDLSRSTKFASHLRVTLGETFTYYVNAFNQGAQACTAVKVADTLNAGVEFVSCTHSCTHSGQGVTWSLGTLAPGASTQVSVTVRVLATSGTLPNKADVTAASGAAGHPSTPGPTVTTTSVLAPGKPATRGPGTGGTSGADLAETGPNPLAALGGAFLVALAYVVRRRVFV